MTSSLTSARTVYLCYFGIHEPLVQTQVLPYLRLLAAEGLDVYLLTFEPRLDRTWTTARRTEAQVQLAAQGIRWLSRRYHKRPSMPATAYDILIGAWAAMRLARRHRIGVLHARAHVPLVMALLAQPVTGCRIVFDLRGLVADEYADAGIWRAGSAVYRVMKWLERFGLRRADQIVVLTQKMRDWIVMQGYARADKIEVIPCCVDLARFAHGSSEPSMDAKKRFELIYAGAVTGLYLVEEIGRFFQAIHSRVPDAFLRILTHGSTEQAATVLRAMGVKEENFWIGPVLPTEVPTRLRQGRLGLSFRKPGFAQIAASPTKIAEYLSAGLPVVTNAGIGDTDELLERERVGVVLRSFDELAMETAAAQALALAADPTVRTRCADVARRHFDLVTIGGEGYANVYRRLQRQQQVPTLQDKISELDPN